MAAYLVVLSVVMALAFCVEIGKQNNWTATFVINRRTYRYSLTAVFWLLIFVTLCLFGGLRYKVGTDYESYSTMFLDICDDWFKNRYVGTEQGYVWLNRIVSLFTHEPQAIFFVTNMIICAVGIFALSRFCRFAPFGMYIYFTTLYYYSFNIIRQGMACNFVFLAIGYGARREWKKCWFWIFVAGFFHQTAWLLMIPLVILMCIKYKPVMYLSVFGIAALMSIFKDTVTVELIGRLYPSMLTFEDAYAYDFSPVQVVQCFLYMALCLVYYKPMLKREKGNILYINFAILTFGIYLLLFWLPMWSRMNLYLIGLYAFIVPEAISCEKSRRIRMIYYGLLLGMLLFFYIVPTLVGGGDWVYMTYWDKLREIAAENAVGGMFQ